VQRDDTVSYRGLAHCGCVWECLHCATHVRSVRAQEVRAAVAAHGQDRTYMLTLTVVHGMGDDLRRIRGGVADAWRRMHQGRWIADWRERVGVVGSIRALEVTHGHNGWHPHLHVLVLVEDDRIEATVAELLERWQAAVERELGAGHVPDAEHGCVLTRCRDADYINKLGLEITDPGDTKRGRVGHRSPWQIGHDIMRWGRDRDRALWRAYCDGMRGARMLTWSVGLRERLRLGQEQTDEQIAEQEATQPEAVLGVIAGRDWEDVARVRGARVRVLELAETHGWTAAAAYVARVVATRRRR
jgi:hypothetical protein